MRTLALLSLPFLLTFAPPSTPLRFAIDGPHSDVTAKVSFFGLASKTAHFPQITGSIELTPQRADVVALDVTLDATALLASDPTTTERLKGMNFFDTTRYPTVHFVGSRMRRTGDASADILGQMTVRGIARPVTLAVRFSRSIATIGGRDAIDIDGCTTINRRDFGMTAYSLIVGRTVAIAIHAHLVPTR